MSFKSAKSLSGTVYSYIVKTASEFKSKLSEETGIPIKMLKLLHEEEGELASEEELLSEEMYAIFVEYGDGLREWVKLCRLDWSNLSSNPAAIKLLEQNLEKMVRSRYWHLIGL